MKIVKLEYSIGTKSLDIFISGCSGNPKCRDCYNPELWDYGKGKYYTEVLGHIQYYVQDFNNLVHNIFIMGGEPLDSYKLFPSQLEDLIQVVKPYNKKMWLFTRYSLEDVPEFFKTNMDYIKCGRYEPELKSNDNIQYGIKLASSNQKIFKQYLDY